ncbi:MAG: FecR family protein [Bacteroidales bacterium]|nr:FecR family protein [Bacteroidales bacterium]
MNKEDNILARWMSGKLTESELEELKKEKDFAQFEKIIDACDNLQAPNYDSEKVWHNIKAAKHKKKRIKFIFNRLSAVAASIVIILGIYLAFNNSTNIKTLACQKKTIQLPDGSQVIMNAISEIKYNAKNWDEKRTLFMTGEAFFKVKKGSKFTVNTNHGSVEVLGTSFNIFDRENIEVTCFTGKVKVTSTENKEILLLPNDKIQIDNQKIIKVKSEELTKPSWINGESRFVNAKLSQVINELERQYNIKIDASNIKEHLFTGTFPHSDKELALKIVFNSLEIEYTSLTNNKVILKEKE